MHSIPESRDSKTLLKVKDLKVHFTHGDEIVKAVDGIDFEIEENEVVGFVGESGSGKTVTALSIMRLLPKNSFSSGEIIFKERNILVLKEKEIIDVRGKGIAMIFQEPFTSLNPVLRIGEQIEEAILTHEFTSKKDVRDKILHILEKVRISDPERIYTSYPHTLSGGERQRAMIAMAIALQPQLLIADEPTTALDVTIQAEILDLLLELKADLNMAILFITHDFGIIDRVAGRVFVMREGKIVEKGVKSDVLSLPKDDYTKRLLEARIMGIDHLPAASEPDSFREGDEKIPSIVIVKNLSKSFSIEKGIFKKEKAKIEAVCDITLEIKEGRTLGVVGESGSGKTTFGKLLIGLLEGDSGEIQISGDNLKRKDVQIVFQDPYNSLDPRMKMQDIVLEGLTIRGASRAEKDSILRDVLFKVHLDYKDRFKYPHYFSGGQRQRIAIARALAVNPKILILDEPISSLDVIIQREILDLLKELQQELALTYVFISHDLRAVAYMADDIAVMQKGKIVELAPKDAILKASHHPYTRRLLESIL